MRLITLLLIAHFLCTNIAAMSKEEFTRQVVKKYSELIERFDSGITTLIDKAPHEYRAELIKESKTLKNNGIPAVTLDDKDIEDAFQATSILAQVDALRKQVENYGALYERTHNLCYPPK